MEKLSQRRQFANGGLSTLYWNYRDRTILSAIRSDDKFIIDAGCGEGVTLERLRKDLLQGNIFGVDIDDHNVNVCKKNSLSVFQGDLLNLGIKDKTVDICIFAEVIEHLVRFDVALRELGRILKPDGRVIVVVPNDRVFLVARLLCLKFKEAFYKSGHVRQWSPTTLQKTLNDHGFTIVSKKNIPFRIWNLCLHSVIVGQKSEPL